MNKFYQIIFYKGMGLKMEYVNNVIISYVKLAPLVIMIWKNVVAAIEKTKILDLQTTIFVNMKKTI